MGLGIGKKGARYSSLFRLIRVNFLHNVSVLHRVYVSKSCSLTTRSRTSHLICISKESPALFSPVPV